MFGHVDDGVFFAEARHPHHRLPGIDHLPGLGVNGGDNAIRIRHQRGVAGLIARYPGLRSGGIAPGGCGLVGILLLVVHALADKFFRQQIFVAQQLGLGKFDIAVSRSQRSAGGGGVQVGILCVDARQHLTLFDAGAQIHIARQNFAGQPE